MLKLLVWCLVNRENGKNPLVKLAASVLIRIPLLYSKWIEVISIPKDQRKYD